MATMFRCLPRMGLVKTPSRSPVKEPLKIYSTENDANCRLLREALDSLELAYICHNVPMSSGVNAEDQKDMFERRKLCELQIANGLISEICRSQCRVTLPHLIDPNTNVRQMSRR